MGSLCRKRERSEELWIGRCVWSGLLICMVSVMNICLTGHRLDILCEVYLKF